MSFSVKKKRDILLDHPKKVYAKNYGTRMHKKHVLSRDVEWKGTGRD